MDKSQLAKVKNIILKNKKKSQKYVRPDITLQDKISSDPSEVKKRLKDFEKIKREDYKYIKPGTFVRYLKKIVNGNYKYCHGGLLVVNAAPVYWVLKAKQRGQNILWSVQLGGDNMYYKKRRSDVPDRTMHDIYSAIKSGEYKLIKTTDLLRLLNQNGRRTTRIEMVGGGDESDGSDDEYNSDEDSSTLESDEDSNDERRMTVVELI